MNVKKVPLRMCVGCKEMRPKKELIRAVKTPDGDIKLDASGKLNGRGAYLCRSAECLEKAKKINALAKAFSMAVSSEIYADLEEEFKKIDG